MAELGTRPATAPAWNTGGANRTTPSGAKQALGYAAREPIASGVMNWLFYWLTAWISYLDAGRPRSFDSLSSAAQTLSAGDAAMVNEYDDSLSPLEVVWGTPITASGQTVAAVCTDGAYIYAGSLNRIDTLDRETGAVLFTTTTVYTANAICTDGVRVYMACQDGLGGGQVRAYTIAANGSLAVVWTYDHTAPVYDVCTDGLNVYFAGLQVDPGDGHGARAIGAVLATDGTWVWSDLPAGFSGSDAMFACCTDGNFIWFGGDLDSGSKNVVRWTTAFSGEALNVWGAGSVKGLAVNDVWVGGVSSDGKIYGERRSRWGSTVVTILSGAFATPRRCLFIGDCLVTCGIPATTGDPTIRVNELSRYTEDAALAIAVYRHGADSGAGALDCRDLACDGFALISCGEEDDAASPGDSVWRHHLATEPCMVARIDETVVPRYGGSSGLTLAVGRPRIAIGGTDA